MNLVSVQFYRITVHFHVVYVQLFFLAFHFSTKSKRKYAFLGYKTVLFA
jgi:hypothetical protein